MIRSTAAELAVAPGVDVVGDLSLRAELGEGDWAVLTFIAQVSALPGAPRSSLSQACAFLGRTPRQVSASVDRLRARGLLRERSSVSHHRHRTTISA